MTKPPPLNPAMQNPLLAGIMQEGDRLAELRGRMAAYAATEDFKALPPLDAHLFMLQIESMTPYLHILQIRLARESDKATGKALDISPTLGQKSNIVLDS